MDHHVTEYFSQYSDKTPNGNFHRVIPLHDAVDIEWEALSEQVPGLSKGWYELMHINPEDRIEFTKAYWLSKLPYRPGLTEALDTFFAQLDTIVVYITQQTWDDPLIPSMVYSLKNNRGFYRGMLPSSEENFLSLQQQFPDLLLPKDFLAFTQIHDGFCKTTDSTGILPTGHIYESYQQLQKILENKDTLTSSRGEVVEPKKLIPFYESFGMPFYQCFWGQWYPEDEMGNVYYSVFTHEIADTDINQPSPENLAFPTFLDWLMFYLEKVV